MTCLKLALTGSKKDPERSLIVQDHCTMMHRFDKRHVTYFRIIRCDDPSLTQQTIQDYLSSDAGAIWDDADTCALVQHYIRNLALLRFANFTNTERLQKEIEFLSTEQKVVMLPFRNAVRHALCHINAYQVRIFAAFLFGMCSIDEIRGARGGQRVEDPYLKDRWTETFKMLLSYYDESQPDVVSEIISSWCWPCFAPPSAMQWLAAQFDLSSEQCTWLQHARSGLQCPEEAQAEKSSFWRFWEGQERFMPLEQRATQAAVVRQQQALAQKNRASTKEEESKMQSSDAARQHRASVEEESKMQSSDAARQRRASAEEKEEEDTKMQSNDVESEQTDPSQAARGEPIVRAKNRHASSSRNRKNVRLEFNAGLRKHVGLRYANLSVESVNRGINRFRWKQKGWCGSATVFVRCDLALLAGNMAAAQNRKTRIHLRATQPRVLETIDLQLRKCRDLCNLRVSLCMDDARTGLAMDLRTVEKDQHIDKIVSQMLHEHLLQFKQDKLPARWVQTNKVLRWIWAQGSEFQFDALQVLRCRQEMWRNYGVDVDLEVLRQRFIEIGYNVDPAEYCEEYRKALADEDE